MQNGLSVSLQDARSFLTGLCGDIKTVYPAVDYAILDPGSLGGRVLTFSSGKYGVVIGTNSMEQNVVSGQVRDSDLAWAAKAVCHERRHVFQKERQFKGADPLSGDVLDMAVMEACAMAYTGYNDKTYAYRLSETDADRHGMRDAIQVLSGAFSDVDWEQAMLDAVNELDQEFDDAREASLSGGLSNTQARRSRVWQSGRRYSSLDEVYLRFDSLDAMCRIAEHEEPCQEFCEHDDDICEANSWDEKFFRLLDGDGTKYGPARDREILASVLQARVFDVEAHFPAMRDTIRSVRSEYQVDTDAVHAMRAAAAQRSSGASPDYDFEHGV